jgi:hypothetical protein
MGDSSEDAQMGSSGAHEGGDYLGSGEPPLPHVRDTQEESLIGLLPVQGVLRRSAGASPHNSGDDVYERPHPSMEGRIRSGCCLQVLTPFGTRKPFQCCDPVAPPCWVGADEPTHVLRPAQPNRYFLLSSLHIRCSGPPRTGSISTG